MELFNFANRHQVQGWVAVDDRVMGGVSQSMLDYNRDGAADFYGEVSTEHGGGFASVRSGKLERSVRGFSGIALRVKGDGKGYSLIARTKSSPSEIYYQAKFHPERGVWRTIRIPFAIFVPKIRGQSVETAPSLDPAKIISLGLMISNRQTGPFHLSISWIHAYRSWERIHSRGPVRHSNGGIAGMKNSSAANGKRK
ncbi:MAG TPA: CIA30 family protein [bacterium]|nr:CIA30 family protein [bacterium]